MKAIKVTKKPLGLVPAFPQDRTLVASVIAAARKVNPRVGGLTHVTATHAVMQALGDPTYYLVEVTPAQAKALGYVA